eukprot:Rhum_TRINITY_DN14890_c15_g2::Rhum_TRINITY_DN14890_c15_g2_i1::g.126634::m.126634
MLATAREERSFLSKKSKRCGSLGGLRRSYDDCNDNDQRDEERQHADPHANHLCRLCPHTDVERLVVDDATRSLRSELDGDQVRPRLVRAVPNRQVSEDGDAVLEDGGVGGDRACGGRVQHGDHDRVVLRLQVAVRVQQLNHHRRHGHPADARARLRVLVLLVRQVAYLARRREEGLRRTLLALRGLRCERLPKPHGNAGKLEHLVEHRPVPLLAGALLLEGVDRSPAHRALAHTALREEGEHARRVVRVPARLHHTHVVGVGVARGGGAEALVVGARRLQLRLVFVVFLLAAAALNGRSGISVGVGVGRGGGRRFVFGGLGERQQTHDADFILVVSASVGVGRAVRQRLAHRGLKLVQLRRRRQLRVHALMQRQVRQRAARPHVRHVHGVGA